MGGAVFPPCYLAGAKLWWGISSWPLPLTLDVGYLLLAAAPDLGRGVAHLGHASMQSVAAKIITMV